MHHRRCRAPAIARKISERGVVVNISSFGARGELVIGASDIAATRWAVAEA